jgi:GntR family transcriptional repressor for pyruvate dehydrogenase complex
MVQGSSTGDRPHGGDRSFALSDTPVQRLTLSDQIAERLISLIDRDGLRAGDELPSESRLAAAFGVSRPVVREALRQLAALRMVKLTNGKPAEVLPVTPDLLGVYFEWAIRQDVNNGRELQELRSGIESMCAELAASRASQAQVDELRAIVAAMRSNLDDMNAYAELDAHLHLAIVSSAQNSLLRHLSESIRRPLKATIEAGLKPLTADHEGLERMQRGHEAIVDAIAARDTARAKAAMERHIDIALKRIATEGARGSSP